MTFEFDGTEHPLMNWAREVCAQSSEASRAARAVRLEISAEEFAYIGVPDWRTRERVVARAYLTEPRCANHDAPRHMSHMSNRYCECGPLAERRF